MPILKNKYPLCSHNWLFREDNLEVQNNSKEVIREWVLTEIFKSYNYPISWLGNQIKLIDSGNSELSIKDFFGICISTTKGEPFLWISISEGNELTNAEASLVSILINSDCSGLGIVTNGTEQGTKFLRRRFDSDKCDYITDIEAYSQPEITSNLKLNIVADSSKTKNSLLPLSSRVENLFFEIHSYIRDIDGFHADEAIDELCKVLYVKLYDEEMTKAGETYSLQKSLYGSVEEFAAFIRALYFEAIEYDKRILRMNISTYQSSRGVLNTKIRLSSPALVKAIESLQNYNISNSDIDIKGRAFQKVINPIIRAGMGQYFTPDAVVRFMVDIASPQIFEIILDPFCGSARFLTSCLHFVRNQNQIESEKLMHEFAFGHLHGIEKSDRMVRIAIIDMRLQGDGNSNIRCTDALLDFSNYPDLKPNSFDLVLTNPPFGSILGSDAISKMGESYLAKGRKTCPLEILSMERSVRFLRNGGRVGIVLPDGILANKNYKYVRDWLEQEAKIRAIISLPIETFSPFGANIKTSILFARKWQKNEDKTQDYSIFLARIDNVGYDTSGRMKDISDFDQVSQEYKLFISREGW
jgi:type I restriction enzyme M protein